MKYVYSLYFVLLKIHTYIMASYKIVPAVFSGLIGLVLLYRLLRTKLPSFSGLKKLLKSRSREWETLRQTLQCPVCHGVDYRKRVLQCGHSLCENCLQSMEPNDGYISCPVCRREQSIQDIPVDYTLTSVQAAILEQQGLPPLQSPTQNEPDVGASLPYRFCILTEVTSTMVSEAVSRILDKLEREFIDGNFVKGYWDERDAPIGRPILENYASSIENSKFILLLIHPTNIKNAWWKFGRYMALTHRLNNPRLINTVIPIYIADRDNPVENVPLELQTLHGIWYDAQNNQEDFWRQLKNVILGTTQDTDLR